jgi:hypothetical protein
MAQVLRGGWEVVSAAVAGARRRAEAGVRGPAWPAVRAGEG